MRSIASLGLFILMVAAFFAFSSQQQIAPANLAGFEIIGQPGPTSQHAERPDLPLAISYEDASAAIISRQENGEIYRWNIATGVKTKLAATNGAFAHCPNNNLIAVSTDTDTRILNSRDGEEVASLPGVNHHAAWDKECRRLTVANEDAARLEIWDVNEKSLLSSTVTLMPVRNGLAMSNDGRVIAAATGQYDDRNGHIGRIEIFNHADDKTIKPQTVVDLQSINGMWTMKFDASSGNLVFGSQQAARSRLVTASTENGDIAWQGAFSNAYWIRAIATSPDGALVASGDEKGELIIRSAANGEPLLTRNLGQVIQSLAFSEDGDQLAVGLKNATIAIMNTEVLP